MDMTSNSRSIRPSPGDDLKTESGIVVVVVVVVIVAAAVAVDGGKLDVGLAK